MCKVSIFQIKNLFWQFNRVGWIRKLLNSQNPKIQYLPEFENQTFFGFPLQLKLFYLTKFSLILLKILKMLPSTLTTFYFFFLHLAMMFLYHFLSVALMNVNWTDFHRFNDVPSEHEESLSSISHPIGTSTSIIEHLLRLEFNSENYMVKYSEDGERGSLEEERNMRARFRSVFREIRTIFPYFKCRLTSSDWLCECMKIAHSVEMS